MSGRFAQRIYGRLPAFARDWACSWEGARLHRLRYGGEFSTYLDQFTRAQSRSADERQAAQFEALRRMLRHCETSVPYYRDLFRRAGFAAGDFRALSDLSRLPVLTKADVQGNAERLRSTAVPARSTVMLSTSGTTGTPLQVAVTPSSVQAYQAAVARHRSWFGVHDGAMSHATFNGRSLLPLGQARPPFWVQNRSGRQTLFSLYHMRDDLLPAYVAELTRTPRDYLDGYPSSVAVLARFMDERGLRLPWVPRAVFLSSETLGDEPRRLIERVFQAPTAQFYGMAEQAASAGQCPEGRFHFDAEIGYVELVPSAHSPGLARIVCTGLINPAQPLVRYDTQDLVALDPAQCPCGRPGLVVERIDGRIESFVVTPEGVRVGRLDHVYKGLAGIRESQIVQTRLDQVVVRVVRAPGFAPADEAQLRASLSRRLGPRMKVAVEYVAELPRTRSGKLRAVISELAGAEPTFETSTMTREEAA